jgi:outer membrane protein assembly factor BamB
MPDADTDGLVHISNLVGRTFEIPNNPSQGPMFLALGYEDNDYTDNGYWNHDDGTNDQCKNIGPAFVILHISRRAPLPPRSGTATVSTYHGDNMRLGWNHQETELRPGTVNSTAFGMLWARRVDGQVYAQPLYVPGVKFSQAGNRNVTFVATEHNTLYAFDADYGIQIWERNLGPSVPASVIGGNDIEGPEYGITGTPVIDRPTQTLYVVTKTLEREPVVLDGRSTRQIYRLHAIDLATGAHRPAWPIIIRGSFPRNDPRSTEGPIEFTPEIQLQRAGLLLLNGRVIVSFGSHHDASLNLYHGWVFSFNASNPAEPPRIFNTTPGPRDPREPNKAMCTSPLPFSTSLDADHPAGGGVWQSGYGLAADERNNIFFETGNGTLTADEPRGTNVGDSVVRLSEDLTFVPDPANFFAPSNQVQLLVCDFDIGASGAMVIPPQLNSHTPRLLAAGSKDGILHLLNRDHLGGFTGRNDPQAQDNALQNIPNDQSDFDRHPMFCGTAYWENPDGHYIFYTRFNDHLHRMQLGTDPTGGGSRLIPAGDTADHFGSDDEDPRQPCPTPVISSSELLPLTGIVWVLRRSDNTLRAYSADSLNLLWSSRVSPGNGAEAMVVKFSVPIVANGRVYVGAKTPPPRIIPGIFPDTPAPDTSTFERIGKGFLISFGPLPEDARVRQLKLHENKPRP